MSEGEINNLFGKINQTREELVEVRTRVGDLITRLAAVESKLDRGQWWAICQLVGIALLLFMFILGWLAP